MDGIWKEPQNIELGSNKYILCVYSGCEGVLITETETAPLHTKTISVMPNYFTLLICMCEPHTQTI